MKNVAKPEGEKTKKKIHIGLKIALIILASVALVLVILLVRHWGTISAVVWGLTDTEENIVAKKEENEKHQNETFEKVVGVSLPDEYKEMFSSGNMTEEEITQTIINLGLPVSSAGENSTSQKSDNSEKTQTENDNVSESTSQVPVQDTGGKTEDAKPPSQDQSSSGNSETDASKNDNAESNTGVTENKPEPKPEVKPEVKPETKPSTNTAKPKPSTQNSTVDPRVAALVARMYVLKNQYTSSIEGVVNSMKADYAKLPKDQQNSASKASIASGYMNKISALEAQCDAQVNSVVTELKTVLKETGKDVSLANEILSAYNSEKEITKAYYINRYSD